MDEWIRLDNKEQRVDCWKYWYRRADSKEHEGLYHKSLVSSYKRDWGEISYLWLRGDVFNS
jgi:hypothetical protein